MRTRVDRTKLWLLPVVICSLVLGLVGTQPASAGSIGPSVAACMQPVFTAAGGGKLNCTANDVVIALAVPTKVNGTACGGTGQPDCTCAEGTTISVDVDVTYELSGGGDKQVRYDLGTYFDVSGDQTNGARTGKCIHATLQDGDAGFTDLDSDACGDINAANNPLTTHIVLTGVVCQKASGTDQLQLPYCLAWRQPGSNEECSAPQITNGTDGIAGNADDVVTTDAFPGSPSKCKCDDNFFINVTVVPPTAAGHKCAVQAISGCTVVRYEVQVTASLPSGSGDTSVTVNSITDSAFGSVTTLHGNASTNGSVTGTTCGQQTLTENPSGTGKGLGTLSEADAAGALPADVTSSGSYTCHFDGAICGAPGTHTNQITAVVQGHPTNQTTTWPANPNLASCSTVQDPVPGDNCNGPEQGNVTITVNSISGTGGNICPE